MAYSTPAALTFAVVAIMLLSTFSPASANAIIGKLYCDKCATGPYDAAAGDTFIVGATVTATCTFSNSKDKTYPTASFTGTGTTDSSGVFLAYLASGTYPYNSLGIDYSYVNYVFKNGKFDEGILPEVEIVGCKIDFISGGSPSGCSVLTYNSGSCSGGNKLGDGNSGSASGSVTLTNYFGDNGFSNVYFGTVDQSSNPVPLPTICLTYPTKPPSCPPPGAKGDPHFSGADGSHFDFSGSPNATFCLLTDAHVHVNAYYGGRFGEYEGNKHKAFTWIRKVGVMWGHHTIYLEAREGARWQYDNGYMAAIKVDGEKVALSQPGEKAVFVDGKITISWVAAKEMSGDDEVDVYQVDVEGVLSMRVTLRPEVENLRTETDGVVHMNLEWPLVEASEGIHGVLGQTYRGDFQDRLAKQTLKFSELLQVAVVEGDNAEGFIDGGVADYVATSLLRADCRVSRFARATGRDSETAQARELAIGKSISSLKVARKYLNI